MKERTVYPSYSFAAHPGARRSEWLRPADGTTRFLRTVTAGIRSRAPGLAVAVRLSAFDLVPYRAGEGGVGEPDGSGPYGYGFGGDGTGLGIDLTETHALLDVFEDLGIGMVSTTARVAAWMRNV